jgi:hypothetical protein
MELVKPVGSKNAAANSSVIIFRNLILQKSFLEIISRLILGYGAFLQFTYTNEAAAFDLVCLVLVDGQIFDHGLLVI